MQIFNRKSNLYYTCGCGTTSKHVTSGIADLRGSSAWATSQRYRDVGDSASQLTGTAIGPQTYRVNNDVLEFEFVLSSSTMLSLDHTDVRAGKERMVCSRNEWSIASYRGAQLERVVLLPLRLRRRNCVGWLRVQAPGCHQCGVLLRQYKAKWSKERRSLWVYSRSSGAFIVADSDWYISQLIVIIFVLVVRKMTSGCWWQCLPVDRHGNRAPNLSG